MPLPPAPLIPPDDPTERSLRRACIKRLLDADASVRAPLNFGIQFIRLAESVPYNGATFLKLKLVHDGDCMYATNDPELYPEIAPRSDEHAGLMDCIGVDGWVLPVRMGLRVGSGARVRVVLTDNLNPRKKNDHLTLMLFEGVLGRVKDAVSLPPDLDLGTLRHAHRVTQDRAMCLSASECDKRSRSFLKIGPVDGLCFGARVAIGRVTVCLDDLWEDIFAMLQRIYDGPGARGTLASAFHQYQEYLDERRPVTGSRRTYQSR